MIGKLGFDIAGENAAKLGKGFGWGLATTIVEALTFIALYRFLIVAFDGRVDNRVIVEAGVVFAIATLLLIVLRAGAYSENFSTTYQIVAKARLRVADHLSRLPMAAFTKKRSELVAELLTSRFQVYQDVVMHIWGMAVVNACLPLLLGLFLLWIDWRLGALCLILVPIAFLAIPWSNRLLVRASVRTDAMRGRAVGAVTDQIDGIREFRLFDRHGRRLAIAHDNLKALEEAQMRLELAAAPALLTFGFVLQFGFGLIAVLGVLVVERGQLEIVSFVAAMMIAQRIFKAAGDLGINLAELRFASAILDDIRALSVEATLSEGHIEELPESHAISVDNVSFSYGEDAVLNRISGEIAAGSKVALVGMSGSGKSTLAGLMARLHDVDEGAIRIGGVDIRDMTAERLNTLVAMVLQDVVLFEGTVADNIRLGNPDANDKEVVRVAEAAEADEFISRLPQGYETRIAPNGGNLSGGERQRIAIARALLKDAPILILDEATSSVDLAHEEKLQRAIARLTRDRTTVVIAHRLWTVRSADQIWVLEGGKIVQRGKHQTLLGQKGRYQSLWRAQSEARSWRLASAQ
ncbi:MAG: ABC transporter ATP-binding protein/permease [Hyphomicrobiales bacterium]|nr:ABC transporter ATP-binding protein/permease [Hyphomicrobiales bacterium]